MRPRYLNDEQLPEWENGPTMVEYLNHMSKQGWRLVTQLRGQEYVFEPLNGFQQREATEPFGQGRSRARRQLDSLDSPAAASQPREQEQ